jgi:Asp-tRNA(Asn)/Glu-tRNA(Gln) amidotransferase A subunit family amidase
MPDLISRPLIEVAQDLRERRITAREIVETCIARHERFGERLHALLSVDTGKGSRNG